MSTERRWVIIVSKLIVRTFESFEEARAYIESHNLSGYDLLPIRLPREEWER